MEKHVYFVRHGESDSNADGVIRGPDASMTEKGKEQVSIVADRIVRIGVEAIVASPFPRAIETARTIGERVGLPIEESDLFVERRRPSALIGKKMKDVDVTAILSEIFEGYGKKEHRHSDEENVEDLKQRLLAALSFLEQHSKNRICVVTHGVFLRLFFPVLVAGNDCSGRDIQHALKALVMDNAGITNARFRSPAKHMAPLGVTANNWQLISWNDSAHLG